MAEKKLKILFIMTHCTKSGPIRQMLNLIKNLDRQVFLPYLVTIYEESRDGDSMLEDYLKVVEHTLISLSKTDIYLGRTGKMKKFIADMQPDVIHSFGVFPDYMVARMKFKAHVLTSRNFVYDDYPDEYGKLMGTMLAKTHLYAIRHTEYAHCCSESLHNIYNEKLGINLPFIRNGVDISKYSVPSPDEKVNLKRKFGLSEDKPVIVYGGVFNERKNQEFLLKCVGGNSSFDGYVFLLLGDGAEYARLKEQYGVYENIVMPGNTTEMPDYLKASDYYISTSKSEGLPNGVLEAMASGLPVFLSDIPQHMEILNVDRRCGASYHADDPDDFIKKLSAFLASDKEEMSKHAETVATEHFSAQIMSRNYQDLYKRIADAKR